MAEFLNMLENNIGFRTIRYNEKDNFNSVPFLQTTFGEWFRGKKENIAKNYSALSNDSLVSKEGMGQI